MNDSEKQKELEKWAEVKRRLNMTHYWVSALTDEALNDPRRLKEIRRQLNSISKQITTELKNRMELH